MLIKLSNVRFDIGIVFYTRLHTYIILHHQNVCLILILFVIFLLFLFVSVSVWLLVYDCRMRVCSLVTWMDHLHYCICFFFFIFFVLFSTLFVATCSSTRCHPILSSELLFLVSFIFWMQNIRNTFKYWNASSHHSFIHWFSHLF